MKELIKTLIAPLFKKRSRNHEIEAVHESGLFDLKFYANATGLPESNDLVAHYVDHGERQGFQPSEHFDASYYRGANEDVARTGKNLLAHFHVHGRTEGRLPLPPQNPTLLKTTGSIEVIADSGLFDLDYYNSQLESNLSLTEAVKHYVESGERTGLHPRVDFDPEFYRTWNKGLEEAGCHEFFLHFVNHGKEEGRLAHPFPTLISDLKQKLNPFRKTVLVVVHEASRSGAPILGWNIAARLKYDWSYNVVVVSLRGMGAIGDVIGRDADIFVAPPSSDRISPESGAWLAKTLARVASPAYAIVNGAVSSDFGTLVAEEGIPVVALIHDFATHFNPLPVFENFYRTADTLVFSSSIIRDSSAQRIPLVSTRERVEILPQGRCMIPPHAAAYLAGVPPISQAGELLLWSKREDVFTVVGLGTLDWRKGVDLFVAAAAAMKTIAGAVKFRFAWVGGQMAHSAELVSYVREQVSRSRVEDVVAFFPETADLEKVYSAADALFLSSRLDPLPNVAIDAMTSGIPVVCFESASGIADILQSRKGLASLVAPYLDVSGVAKVLLGLAVSRAFYSSVAAETKSVAVELFNMKSYVAQLDEMGRAASRRASVVIGAEE